MVEWSTAEKRPWKSIPAFCQPPITKLCNDMRMAIDSALDELLNPSAGWLTPQAAQQLVDWKLSDALRHRVEELGAKANRGLLTPEEDADYRAYLDDAELISLMQAMARRNYRTKT
jgi:hypothetical protein